MLANFYNILELCLKIFRYHFDIITIQHMLTPEVDNMVTQHIVHKDWES